MPGTPSAITSCSQPSAARRTPSTRCPGVRWGPESNLRGSRDGAVPGVHLVSAFDRDAKSVLAQVSVGDTNEAKAALVLLGLIPLEGVVVTGDAAFTHREFCERVIAGGGDYFQPVKDNQPDLKAAIATGFGRAFSPGGAPAPPGGG